MKTAETPLFLLVSGDFEHTVIALCEGEKTRAHLDLRDARLSAQLTVSIDELLTAQTTALTDLDFIAVVQGPGSFNHLRATLATMNGVSAASGIPLVGIDTLQAWCNYMSGRSLKNPESNVLLVVVYNAFNNQIHYQVEKISCGTRTRLLGPAYGPISEVEELIASCTEPGVMTFYMGQAGMFIKHPSPTGPFVFINDLLSMKLECLATEAWSNWRAHIQPTYELQPLYLKETMFKKSDPEPEQK